MAHLIDYDKIMYQLSHGHKISIKLLMLLRYENYSSVYTNNLHIPVEIFKYIISFLDYYPSSIAKLALVSKGLYLHIDLQHLYLRYQQIGIDYVNIIGGKYTLCNISTEKQSYELCLKVIKKNGMALKNVKIQTEQICLEAVRQNGYALQYVRNQTEQICLDAVRQTSFALYYVHNQTEQICLEAVRLNGYALQYVLNQTEQICLEAVRQNGYALQYVRNQTEQICLEAVKNDGLSLQYVQNRTDQIYLEAVKQNILAQVLW
jgi:hypothetical protein